MALLSCTCRRSINLLCALFTLCICGILDFLGLFSMVSNEAYIALEFNDVSITALSAETKYHRRSVYLLDDGRSQEDSLSVLKLYGNTHTFHHSLYIQQIIERSKYQNITVSMLGFNRDQKWIRFAAGLPIHRNKESGTRFFRDHPDWQEQIMRIHRALASLGIVHNDVHPGNFLLSKADPTKILIFDFGNSLMRNQPALWLNRRHIELLGIREYRMWFSNEMRYQHMWKDITEFERVLRNFPKWFNASDSTDSGSMHRSAYGFNFQHNQPPT